MEIAVTRAVILSDMLMMLSDSLRLSSLPDCADFSKLSMTYSMPSLSMELVEMSSSWSVSIFLKY